MEAGRGVPRRGMQQALEPQLYGHKGRKRGGAMAAYTVSELPARRPKRRTEAAFKILDGTGDGTNSAYAHRVGTLFRLADLLAAEGVLDGPLDGMEAQHRLQKCAYIAQQLGANVDYEFGFMGNGAFSADLAVDADQRDAAHGGSDPFARVPGRLAEFLALVRGHSTEWLQLMTFAVQPTGSPPSRAEFVDRVAWRGSGYDRRRAARVFDAAAALRSASGEARGA